MNDLKKVYRASGSTEATNNLYDFMDKYHKNYPKTVEVLNDLESLSTFYSFRTNIQSSIYTTNLIENFNKNLKRGTKRKEQFPNEDSLERYVWSFCTDYNQNFSIRIHRSFK